MSAFWHSSLLKCSIAFGFLADATLAFLPFMASFPCEALAEGVVTSSIPVTYVTLWRVADIVKQAHETANELAAGLWLRRSPPQLF